MILTVLFFVGLAVYAYLGGASEDPKRKNVIGLIIFWIIVGLLALFYISNSPSKPIDAYPRIHSGWRDR